MKVAFVLIENMLATSVSNAYEMFYAANQVAKRFRDQPGTQAALHKVAKDQRRIEMPSGLSFAADQTFTETAYDMVYVPAMWRNPRPMLSRSPELVEWLRWQFQHGAIINGTGTGVCFLAEAGLLNDKPATTHWYYFEQFAKQYPRVQLKRQHFITAAGKLFCAGSINAQTDLNLHHVHRFYGKPTADHLSQHFSHEVRQSFDRLSFNQEENTNHPDEVVLQTQLWMQNNLSSHSISIERLAQQFGMSPRNFSRRFKAASNLTPLQYLQKQRLVAAKELLQSSNLSIAEIAYRVGYLDVSYFSQLFKEFSSTTPGQFRTSMRAKLFDSSTR